ncbi:MAG: glycosyltransferase, partial [Alphaproteobacteria bacterium]
QADLVRDNDCGLAVPAEDPDALARAVADLAADPASVKAMGARGRDAIVAAHSWDIRAGATQEVLMRLTNRVPGI